MNKISPWLYGVAGAALIAVGFGLGFGLQRVIKNGEIADLRLEHQRVYNIAQGEKIAADARALVAERAKTLAISNLEAAYVAAAENEKNINARAIADLRDGSVRLRVSTAAAVSTCQLPGPVAGAGSGDGKAQQTLVPAVAARLAERYADYNALVDQLALCQGVVAADRVTEQ